MHELLNLSKNLKHYINKSSITSEELSKLLLDSNLTLEQIQNGIRKEELRRACEHAKKIVDSWPEWKRKACYAILTQPFYDYEFGC